MGEREARSHSAARRRTNGSPLSRGRQVFFRARAYSAGAVGRRHPPMTVFIIRRLMQSILVLFAMSAIVFFGVYIVGNPIEILIAPDADDVERARAMAALGLDRSVWAQYLAFLEHAITGDLGRSFVFGIP